MANTVQVLSVVFHQAKVSTLLQSLCRIQIYQIQLISHIFTYNPIILDGNWIFPFSQLTLGIYFHL